MRCALIYLLDREYKSERERERERERKKKEERERERSIENIWRKTYQILWTK